MKGDICPPDFLVGMVIESKFYKQFPYHALLSPGPVPQLDAWIAQTLDCAEPGDEYFVCFKANLRGWHVVFPLDKLEHYYVQNHCVYTGAHGKFIVTELKSFFETNASIVRHRCAPRHGKKTPLAAS